MSLSQVNLMHIAVIGPLLYVIGDQAEKKGNVDKWLFHALATLTILIIFIVRPPFPFEFNYRNLVNISHYTLILALFGWISYRQNAIDIEILKSMKLLGIVVIAIHLYLLISKLYVKGLN
jgi:hypothetical protein